MSVDAPRTRECLSVVVASAGKNFQSSERLQPFTATPLASGATVVEDDQFAAYTYLGDVLLRFVFTAKDCMETPMRLKDMKLLDLTPIRALALATINFKRDHGAPLANLFAAGVYTLHGGNPDVNATYFLDRSYWRGQLDRFGQAVIVALPRRGSLYFASAADPAAIQELTRLAARFFHAADEQGLSGYLYRFDAQGWHIQECLPQALTGAGANVTPRLRDSSARNATDGARHRAERDVERNEEEAQEKLALAAQGQKMVIYSILLNLLLRAVERSLALPDVVLFALSIGVAVYALNGVVKICSGLGTTQNKKILFMVWTFFPVINLVALVYLSVKTSSVLRRAGWKVGLLGAKSA